MSEKRNPRFNVEFPEPTYKLLLRLNGDQQVRCGESVPLIQTMFACIVESCRKADIPVSSDDIPKMRPSLRKHLRLD